MEGDQAFSRRYLERLPVLVSAGFGETGRGCSSITALLLMQFLFWWGRKDGSGCPPASSPREGAWDSLPPLMSSRSAAGTADCYCWKSD